MDESVYHRSREIESRHWWFAARREILLQVLAGRLEPNARVLDVGSGTGFMLEALARRYRVAGLEPSPIALRFCHDRGLTSVVPGTATDYSKLSGSGFDAILFLDVIEHLDDAGAALRTARAALRPGGLIFVTVPAYQWLWSSHDVIHQHRRRYTGQALTAEFEAAGLTVERCTYFNARLFPLALGERLLRQLLRHPGADLSVPPAPLNGLLRRIFEGEGPRVAAGKGYPFGLSILGIGRAGG